MGYAIVNIWLPHGSNVGHASMQLEDGTYISWWPAGKGKSSLGDLNWAISKADTANNLAENIVNEDGRQPDKYRIDGLNVAKMRKWWSKNNYGTYVVMKQNCCDIVLNALSEGGKDISLWTLLSRPEHLAEALQGYEI